MQFTFDIKGMHCKSCVMLIQEELEDAGAQGVTMTLDAQKQQGTASGEYEKPDELIPKIEVLGEYEVKRVS